MRVESATSAKNLSIEVLAKNSQTGSAAGEWSEILSRASDLSKIGARADLSSGRTLEQLSGLLKIQSDMSRYQLRVELLSKVSESAVTSIRKLQQNQ
jgi:hypothetical protein